MLRRATAQSATHPSSTAGGAVIAAVVAAVLLIAPLGVSVLALRTDEKTNSPVLRLMALTVVVIGSVTLAICDSRSAWIAIWLILVGLLVKGIRSWLARTVVGAIVVAPLFVAIGGMLFSSQADFIWKAGSVWSSGRGRILIATQAIERWKESPWLGIGLNEFRAVYKHEGAGPAGDVAHAHNMVLQTALDVGVLGSAAYWGVLALLLVRATQAAKRQSGLCRSAAVGSALSLVAISLFGLSDAVPIGCKVGTLQWMAGGLILAAWRMQSVSAPQGVGDYATSPGRAVNAT